MRSEFFKHFLNFLRLCISRRLYMKIAMVEHRAGSEHDAEQNGENGPAHVFTNAKLTGRGSRSDPKIRLSAVL